jgi:sodium/hydrogen exchanger 8
LNHFYHALAYNFETLVFLLIGIGAVGFDLAWSEMGVGLAIFSLTSIFLARYANIELISRVANLYRSKDKITKQWKIAMWFSGLRGAMAYALSLEST